MYNYFQIKNKVNNRVILINEIFIDLFLRIYIKMPQIKSIEETINKILKDKCSVVRFGDGELDIISGKDIAFQQYSKELSDRLKQVLKSSDEGVIVCIPDVFEDLKKYRNDGCIFWKNNLRKTRKIWSEQILSGKVYYNAFISRFYYIFKDKSKCQNTVVGLKKIWNDRHIVIIEGKKSRLGIGNDLFFNAKSIERILCPEVNAFTKYNDIFEEVTKLDKNKLIIIALGPTATVLAYDLYLKGYQALDLGHVDVEYEWFLRRAQSKIPIENKYVNESVNGRDIGDVKDRQYLSEIIALID